MRNRKLFSVVAIILILATFLTLGLSGCKKSDEMVNEKGADAFINWMNLASTRALIADYGKDEYNASLFSLIADAEISKAKEEDLTFAKSGAKNNVVRISTTTSVNDTGLLPFLQPKFEELGWKMEVHSAGTGAAIESAEAGNADLILVHSKSAEEAFLEKGFGRKVEGYTKERLSFMFNYFVVVGPTADPAGIKDSTDPEAAFQSIFDGEHLFVSRGDKSGTYNKEITLWPAAAKLNEKDDPTKQAKYDWYKSVGKGMGDTLTMANEGIEKVKDDGLAIVGYTLSDNGTYLRYKNDKAGDKIPKLTDMNVTGASLKNTYSMIALTNEAFKK